MKEEVVALVSLVLEGQGEDEEREPYGSETVEPEGEGEEPEPSWRDFLKPSTIRESPSPPFLGKTGEGGSSRDIDERLRKIEANIEALQQRVSDVVDYVNKRTEKIQELTETVNHMHKFLQETFP